LQALLARQTQTIEETKAALTAAQAQARLAASDRDAVRDNLSTQLLAAENAARQARLACEAREAEIANLTATHTSTGQQAERSSAEYQRALNAMK
jgi:hypothetical protein